MPQPPPCGDRHTAALQAAEARAQAAAEAAAEQPRQLQLADDAPDTQQVEGELARAAELARLGTFLDDMTAAGPTLGTVARLRPDLLDR
eukprot:8642404-Lingulodinium_polyedra.AAC.1